jgi:hypothetical protein
MRLKVTEIGAALHPSEVIVEVRTAEGVERLVIDSISIQNGTIDVGFPVGKRNGHLLVELPRESFRGAWRIWVARDKLVGQLKDVA